MSRVFSFRDLQLIPELSHLTEHRMVRLNSDSLVNKALSQLGFSLRRPIFYVPCLHRDLQGNVAVGFRATGTLNEDPLYRESSLCPQIERLLWAARRDGSLAAELARMIGHSINLDDDSAPEPMAYIEDEYIEPDYQKNAALIAELESYRDLVRGNPYNEYGSLKLPHEYV